MRATNKHDDITVHVDSDGDNSGSAKEASAGRSQAGYGSTLDSQTRIRVRSFAICIVPAELTGNRGCSGLRKFSLSR